MLDSVRATIELLTLNIIAIWITSNPDIKGSKKSKDQKSAINNMKKLYKWWKKFIKLFNGYSRIEFEAKHKTNYGEGSTFENLLNEIKQNKLLKKYTIQWIL